MSNALSIAATTLTLRSLLGQVASADYSTLPADARPINQIEITTLPPDQARGLTRVEALQGAITSLSGSFCSATLCGCFTIIPCWVVAR